MKGNNLFNDLILDLALEKRMYKKEAYFFLLSALDYYLKKINEVRHVTGNELCVGIKEYALKEFGIMTLTVLSEWGIRKTQDFGNIVYHLIEKGLLGKTETDSITDFNNVYDLNVVFNPENILTSTVSVY